MLRNRWLRFVSCSIAVLVVGVSGASASPIFSDPINDTFGSGVHDITSINATFTGTGLRFDVTFLGTISPASAFAGNSVVGYIDIDSDQNPSTGVGSNLVAFGQGDPVPGLGVEFYIDLFSEAFNPGFVDVIDTSTGFPVFGSPVAITYGPTSLSVTVPLSLLGNNNGLVNYGVIVGTFVDATDQAPNAGAPVAFSTIPEPGSMTVFGIAVLGLLCYGRPGFRRRFAS